MVVDYPLDIVVFSALGADMYDCVYFTRTARFGTALVPEGVLKLKHLAMAIGIRPIDPTGQCMATPVYVSEMAPPKLRGAFNIVFQFFIGTGVVAAGCLNYGTARLDWGWRHDIRCIPHFGHTLQPCGTRFPRLLLIIMVDDFCLFRVEYKCLNVRGHQLEDRIAQLPKDRIAQLPEDRISQLHDDILVVILSFLKLKQAAPTSVLSKRWTTLWMYNPRLDFAAPKALKNIAQNLRSIPQNFEVVEVERHNYVDWINCIMQLHKGSPLWMNSGLFSVQQSLSLSE
ncbi:hypothetical protein ACH5RR_034575 [Cinchona calisaya]|uniref:F-box domain-containing protein n=1 Tax=Cinchona calisaya TaxID=153742 RepID=A0ABD2YBA8_9GENT